MSYKQPDKHSNLLDILRAIENPLHHVETGQEGTVTRDIKAEKDMGIPFQEDCNAVIHRACNEKWETFMRSYGL